MVSTGSGYWAHQRESHLAKLPDVGPAPHRPGHIVVPMPADTTPSTDYLAEVGRVAASIDPQQLEAMARGLAEVRDGGGRLFIIGVGGGAGHASHAVNDFRKICH